MSIPADEMGGPTFFAIMMKVMTSMSEEGVCAMIEKICLMNISNIKGENVSNAMGLLRVAIGRLRNLNKLPMDLTHQLTMIFQTSSVECFNRLFEMVETSVRLQVKNFTYNEILDLAEATYIEFTERKLWSGVDNSDSTYVANKSDGSNKDVTCWKCGEVGHRSDACPNPQTPNTQPQQRGNRGGNDAWKTVPPLESEPNRCNKNGKTYFWCGHDKCKCWNLTHVTKDHVTGVGRNGQNRPVQSPPAGARVHHTEAPESVVAPEYRTDHCVSFANSLCDAVGHIQGLN